jgi:hypothetical protein
MKEDDILLHPEEAKSEHIEDKRVEKLDYAMDLIEVGDVSQTSVGGKLQNALNIMKFGHISIDEMLEYLEATGR